MNLLNGFTGLFSLGQAGFMLLGAYTYAILTVPVSAKDSVYYLYGGSAVPFSLPDLFGGVDTPAGLILGVLLAILLGGLRGRRLCLAHRPAGAAAEERLPGHRHPGLCGDHPGRVPVAGPWARSPTAPI